MGSRTQHKSEIKQLSEKIKDVRIVMMTTIELNGDLHSRPMIAQDVDAVEFDGDLWFLTLTGSSKAMNIKEYQQVNLNQQVNLSYSKPDKNLFVSVSGTAQIVDDHKKVKDLWNSLAQAWFHSGPDDPEIVLLKVHVTSAEYWDAHSGKMGGLLAVAKQAVVKRLTSHDGNPVGADVKLDMHAST